MTTGTRRSFASTLYPSLYARWKSWSTRFLKGSLVMNLASHLVALYIHLIYRTTRWERLGNQEGLEYFFGGKRAIFLFWHGRMLMFPGAWEHRCRMHAVVSLHRDGQLVGRVLRRFSIEPIGGSTHRGGVGAMRQVLRTLQTPGTAVSITPDGPRGPRMRLQGHAVALARYTGVPIVLLTYATAWGRLLRSWDRMLLPYPVGRGILMASEPIHVTPNLDDIAYTQLHHHLEARLNSMTQQADAQLGRLPVEPAPPVQAV